MVAISLGKLWKQPCHEIHGANGHAHAKDDARQGALGLTLTEREDQTTDDNRDHRKCPRDGRSECCLQNLDGILPGRTAGRRIERCGGQENACAGQCTFRYGKVQSPDCNLSCVAKCELRKTLMHLRPPRIIQTKSDDSAESNGQDLLSSSGFLIAISTSMKKCKNPQTFVFRLLVGLL